VRHLVVSIGIAVAGIALLAAAEGATRQRLDDLAWMAGSWVSREDGKVSEEHWTSPAGGLMLGVHRDVGGGKTGFEFLRIEERGGKVTYLASPQGREATPFALVESAKQRAVFANPEHDFPQRILYWREGESLCAAIEGPMNGETVSERWCWAPGSLR
jgi:Domain of unknown function (DUF6265)